MLSTAEFDQKDVLFQCISQYVDSTKSVLDIGAGTPEIAKRIARISGHYLGIEQRADYCNELRAAGLRIIEGLYPLELKQKYDVVIASHSVPEAKELIRPFIGSMWADTSPGGKMILITFKGAFGEIAEFRDKLLGEYKPNDEELYAEIVSSFEEIGEYRSSTITSRIFASNPEDIANFISAGISSNITDELFRNIVELVRYNQKIGRYSFSFDHLVFEINKAPTRG